MKVPALGDHTHLARMARWRLLLVRVGSRPCHLAGPRQRVPQQRALLNRLVHPAVLAAWQERLAALREEHPEGIVVSDIPLLVEVGMGALLDLVILVYVAPEEQIRRLTARNGLTREDAVQRLASQMPLDEKIRHAQAVIDNNGDREATRAQVETLWGTLRERERALRLGM